MIYKVYLQNLNKQVRTPPVRPADGVVGCVYESFALSAGADLVAATQCLRVREIPYAYNVPL